jgi:hypothetical protein
MFGAAVAGAISFERPRLVVAQAATPTTDVAGTALFEISFPREDLPAPPYGVGSGSSRVPAGTSSTLGFDGRVIVLNYIRNGIMVVPVSGRTQVVRADGSVEFPREGEDITLGPEDALIEYDFASPKTYANPNEEDCDLLFAEFYEPPYVSHKTVDFDGSRVQFRTFGFLDASDWETGDLSGHPVHLTIGEIRIDPGETVELETVSAVTRHVETGEVVYMVTRSGENVIPETRSIADMPYYDQQPGDIFAVRNDGDTVAIVFEFVLAPDLSD